MERRPLAEKNAVTHALTRALKAACEGYWRAAVLLYSEDITLLNELPLVPRTNAECATANDALSIKTLLFC